MKRARSIVVLAALALAALVAVLAVFQRDSGIRQVAPSGAVAPQSRRGHSDVATIAPDSRGTAEHVASDETDSSARTATASLQVDNAPEIPPGGVSGRVTDRSTKEGIANAHVRVTIERSDELREVAELVTDIDGRYEGVIAELATWSAIERDTTRVLADASADGYVPAQSWSYATSDGNRIRNLDVVLDDGDVMRGRVVDELGKPAVYASVEAFRYADVDGGVVEIERARPRETRADAHGEFICGYRAAGSAQTWVVSARDPNIGCGRSVVRVPTQTAPLDVGDIVLREFGVLAGRLISADGKPLPGVDLKIAIVRAPKARDDRFDMNEFITTRGEWSNREGILVQLQLDADEKSLPDFTGRDSARTHTDERGHFRVPGLQPGDYTIRIEFGGVGDSTNNGALVDSDGSAAFRTGSRALSLVANGAWIHARVVDAGGASVSGSELEYAVLDERGSNEATSAKWTTVELDHGETSHRFDAGSRVALRAKAGDGTSGERVVEAPQSGVVDVLLTLKPELAPGRMRVKITLPDGDECRAYAITLRSPTSHLPCTTYREFDADENGWSPEIPAGTYELQVQVRERQDYFEPRLLPIHAGPVTIGPGSAPDLDFTAQLGGRLELKVRAPLYGWHESGSVFFSKVTLTDRGEHSTELEMEYDWINPEKSEGSLSIERYAAVGPLLAAGAYQLHVECSGFDPIDVAVAITGGETTYAEFDLVPQPKK